MVFEQLLDAVGSEPLFETGLLLAGEVDPRDVRRQLSRWTTAGKIRQLRRGLYCLAPSYAKVIPHPFVVANRLRPGSYVSLQSALAYYGMIPELVPVTTSVGAGRPTRFDTPLGRYEFRHIRPDWLRGYTRVEVENNQMAFIATPEKALLDMVYLHTGADSVGYLGALRLQSLERLDLEELRRLARLSKKPKLLRAAKVLQALAGEEANAFESL